MLKKKFNSKLTFLLLILLFIFVIQNVINGYKNLGIFADDIGTIYQLNQIYDFASLIRYSLGYDAARDLHQIWLKIFLIISGSNWMQNIHLIQFVLYLINSFLFLYILSLLKISLITKILVWFLSIYFSAYSEVALWIHASSMILMSALFFLIFLIFNIKLLDKNLEKKNFITYEIILLLLSILSIETYEQPLFAIFLIIFSRIVLNKYYENNKIRCYFTILIYFFFIISFSIFKIWTSLPYQTGSKINLLNGQFFFNIFKSFAFPLIEFLRFNKNNYSIEIFFLTFCILTFIIAYNKYIINFNKKKQTEFFLPVIKKTLLCLVLYVGSFVTLYVHYISDRHFYIPSFFMFIAIAYLMDYLNLYLKFYYKNIVVVSLPIIIITIFSINAFLNFNSKKLNQIRSVTIKNNFYKNLINNPNIDFSCNCFYENKVFLINFPDFYNGSIFFAHEQDVVLKLLYNDNFPKIEKLEEKLKILKEKDKTIYYITYLGLKYDNIIYRINKQ